VIVATIEIAQPGTVRLVHSERLKPAVLERLVPHANLLMTLTELEGVTSDRWAEEAPGIAEFDPREMVFNVPHANIINAAFAYSRVTGNRFNGPRRGAWYCAFGVETAIAEIGFHLTRELDYIGRYDNVGDYAELLADFIGRYHDLRTVKPFPPCLHPDPTIGYPVGQELAAALMREGSPGLIYPSVRYRRGTCLVAFRPSAVQNVREGAMWRLTWAGSRDYTVSRLPS
jgi:RES domain